jgi:hypothetical protein
MSREQAAEEWIEQYAFHVPYHLKGPIANDDFYDEKKLKYGKTSRITL